VRGRRFLIGGPSILADGVDRFDRGDTFDSASLQPFLPSHHQSGLFEQQ
jgi:hypothetical protein